MCYLYDEKVETVGRAVRRYKLLSALTGLFYGMVRRRTEANRQRCRKTTTRNTRQPAKLDGFRRFENLDLYWPVVSSYQHAR